MRGFGILALALAAVLAPRAVRGAEPEAVARVNGEVVTRAELDRMAASPVTVREAGRQLGAGRPAPRALEGLALRKLVHLRLLLQEARRRKIEVTDRELDREIASLRRRFGDLRRFGAWMKEQGLDDRSLFRAVRDDMVADRVREALVADVDVSDEHVRSYYDEHREDFRPEEVRLQVIALADEAEAEDVVQALRAGASFDRMARARSRGLLAAKGGDTGWVALASLPSPLREAAVELEPGLARGPLRRGSDLLVVRLRDRRRGAPMELSEARPAIERRLLPERRRVALEAWLLEREGRAEIELLRPLAKGEASGGLVAPATARGR